MKLLKVLTLLLALSVIYVVFPRNTKGSELDKKTIVTTNGPMEVPGFYQPIVLPAGTYVFRVMDSLGSRDTVEIWNEYETKLITMTLAMPASRLYPTDQSVFRFGENVPGSPEVLKEWFYPGERTGFEFAYPRSAAQKIAKANHERVLALVGKTGTTYVTP